VTNDPILIAETGAAPQAGKAAKIADLFAGIKASDMLGLVWFDAIGNEDWRIDDDKSAVAAYRDGAETYGAHLQVSPVASDTIISVTTGALVSFGYPVVWRNSAD
jgi:hypothetical protein